VRLKTENAELRLQHAVDVADNRRLSSAKGIADDLHDFYRDEFVRITHQTEELRQARAENEALRMQAKQADERGDDAMRRAHAAEAELEVARRDAQVAVGKTASRCIAMALWPAGVEDEQAYYGRMFAQFIESEFCAAIDAAMESKT
jgi:hypothetical protein